MSIAERVFTAPDQVWADLAALRVLSWPDIFANLDRGVDAVEGTLKRLKWTMVSSEYSITVQLPSSSAYAFNEFLTHTMHAVWTVKASDKQENEDLFVQAEQVWPGYLAAATAALGVPAALQAWDDPDFRPMFTWTSESFRRANRTPLRVARWSFGRTDFLLWINVTMGTASRRCPGQIEILVTILAPHGARA